MGPVNFRSILVFSAIFRVVLIIFGEWQDTHLEVRYTDVDYLVFSDAAALMAAGESPYKRTTFRYSPLLSFLLLPNSLLHRSWGKIIFSASDLLVGMLIRNILKQRKVPETLCIYSVLAWLINPFTFTIGTRGNCEPVVCAMILWIILCLMNGKLLHAAFWYGLVVHFRIYPIIYALPIVLILDPHVCQSSQSFCCSVWKPDEGKKSIPGDPLLHGPLIAWRSIFTRERIMFGLVAGSVFFFFTTLSFFLYGWEFLREALIYHLTRTDPRHNFSIYFYHIYLHSEYKFSMMEKLISFLPQVTVQLVLVFCFARDLPFCLFLQTVAFVAFNKVMTAQYFVWFFCLLPLILPWSTVKWKWNGICCMLLWMGAQTHWLFWAYMLEFKGKNVFVPLWIGSLVFFACNTILAIIFIRRQRLSPLFTTELEPVSCKDAAKCT